MEDTGENSPNDVHMMDVQKAKTDAVQLAFPYPVANFHTMPFDIILSIVKLKAFVEEKHFQFIARSLSRICRSLRQIVTSHPPFWTHISSRTSQSLQLACLERSRDALLDVALEYARPEGSCKDLEWTLTQAIPHAHRWATFSATLCSEKRKRRENCTYRKHLLNSTIDVPKLRVIHVVYYNSKTANGPRNYAFQPVTRKSEFDDVGEYGCFFSKWKTPALTHLVSINYIPHPNIVHTLKKLKLQFDGPINEACFFESLSAAESLEEFHIVFEPGAKGEGRFLQEDTDDGAEVTIGKPVRELPQIRKLTVALYDGDWGVLTDHFHFPNLNEFVILRHFDKRTRSILSASSRVARFIFTMTLNYGFPHQVDTIRLVEDISLSVFRQTLGRSLFSLRCRRLEIVGDCWVMVSDSITEISHVPEEVHLIECDEGLASLVQDVTVGAPCEKTRVVRLVDCAPSLMDMLGAVPPEKLEIWKRDEFEKAYPESRFRATIR